MRSGSKSNDRSKGKGTVVRTACHYRSHAAAGDIPLYEGDIDEDLKLVSRNRLAEKLTGGLSLTTDMPCPSR